MTVLTPLSGGEGLKIGPIRAHRLSRANGMLDTHEAG
jgi:hypothetical protein